MKNRVDEFVANPRHALFTLAAPVGIAMILSRVLQGMGFGLPGFIINVVRIFIVAVPLAYVFVFVQGYDFLSIAWAMVAGGVTASLLAFWWLGQKFKSLP